MSRVGGHPKGLGLAVLMAGLLLGATRGAAQAPDERQVLRQAAALESQGDHEGARRMLEALLEAAPTSLGGLYALERVLRAEGALEGLLPRVEAFLNRQPEADGVQGLRLRILRETGDTTRLRATAEAWLASAPGRAAPYREVAQVFEGAFGPGAAVEVLRRGREAVGDERAFGLELGDLLLESDPEAALLEWGKAVGPDGRETNGVVRRVQRLEGERRGVEALVRMLWREGDDARRRAAVLVALAGGLESEAADGARALASALEGRAREVFLSDIARRAREAGQTEVAAWAYEELGAEARTAAERRQFDARRVQVALQAGDTAAAVEAQHRLATSFPRGTVERRRALAETLRLRTALHGAEELRDALADFRLEYPAAPELDELAATVARALLGEGDGDGAAAVLEGVEGPRSGVERGYLLLSAGRTSDGVEALLLAVPDLPPAAATGIIQFVSLLRRLSPPSGALLAAAATQAHRGDGPGAAATIQNGLDALAEEERAAVLAEGARLADAAGAPREGAGLRRILLEAFPDAPEAGEAALDLARWDVALGDTAGAVARLEELIARRPNAAVVPAARRVLERIQGGGG